MAELGLHCHKNVLLRSTYVRVFGVKGVTHGPCMVHFHLPRTACLPLCPAAMLTDETCLGVDLPLPKCLSESFGLATDDICHFTTRGMEHAQEDWNRIDRAFQNLVLAVTRPNESLVLWMVHASGQTFFQSAIFWTICP